MPFVVIFILIILLLVVPNIVIVPERWAYVVEQLGAFHRIMGTGLNFKVPLIQRVAKRVSLKEQVLDYPPQPVITKDNVTMHIDTVVYFQITNPKLYAYGVDNPMMAMETLTATTLRNIIGELELDETLTSRDQINARMSKELDVSTDPWGIKVNRVELKNIMPPKDIQEAMEKQMRAERGKRESILRAEGEKQSAILQAEGEKEAAILRADAKKIEVLREAEAHAESIRMHKEAEAEGILKIQTAEVKAINALKQIGLENEEVIKLRSLDAFKVVGDGQATKIIIPSEIQSMTGLLSGLKESTEK